MRLKTGAFCGCILASYLMASDTVGIDVESLLDDNELQLNLDKYILKILHKDKETEAGRHNSFLKRFISTSPKAIKHEVAAAEAGKSKVPLATNAKDDSVNSKKNTAPVEEPKPFKVKQSQIAYFDYQGSTPCYDVDVKRLFLDALNYPGNPSSLSRRGRFLNKVYDHAREIFAGLLNVKKEEIIFTSGATESNNIAILGYVRSLPKDAHIITTAIEHASVLNTFKALKGEGYDVTFLKVDKNGNGNCYPCMGCRSFLTPWVDENGKPKYYGRFNQGVVTVNLIDIALSAEKDMTKFWQIFDERMDLCHRALQCRHERLTGTITDVAPILWQHGALARLKPGEVIDSLLHGGYSTISLGYAGLWETVYALIGKKLTEPEGKALGIKILEKLNEYTKMWKMAENIDYSLYGTPLESTTYKFAKTLQKRFGIIEGVTDKNYVTNSYHVHVTEPIDAFSKLALESEFQALSPGGAISYVEVPNMQNNIEAVLQVMKFIYDNIMYAELNTKSDYCHVCSYDGEIQVKDDDGKLIWECPNCKNRDQTKMNVARRTCGYIGSQFWNQGRTAEIKDRVLHL